MGGFLSSVGNLLDPATTALQTVVGGGSLKTAAGQLLDPGGFTSNNPKGLFSPDQTAASKTQELADYASQAAEPYLKAYETGTLTAGQKAELDLQTRSAKGQTAASFARSGMGQSSSLVEANNLIDEEAKSATNQFLQEDLVKGLDLLGAGSGLLGESANLQLQQNAMMGEAMGNAAQGIGAILADSGKKSGSGGGG